MPLSGTQMRELQRRYRAGELTPAAAAAFEENYPDLGGPMTDPMTGMPMPRTPEEAAEMRQGLAQTGRLALDLGLGVGLPVAGAALGAASPIPGGAFLGETAGSLAATGLSDVLGLSDPGALGYGVSAALPGAAKVAGRALKGAARLLPGVGRAMQDVTVEALREIVPQFAPPEPSLGLYRKLAQKNPTIKMTESIAEAKRLLAEQATVGPELQSPIVTSARGVKQLPEPELPPATPRRMGFTRDIDIAQAITSLPADEIDFRTLRLAQREIRSRMRATSEDALRHQLGQLDAAIMRDMEAGSGPTADLLKRANKAYRTERALIDLHKLIEGSLTEASQGTGLGRFNAGVMLKKFDAKLSADDLFAKSFEADEIDTIRNIFREYSKVPLAGGPGGEALRRTAYAAGGGVLGGVPGAIAGVALPVVMQAALTSKPGLAMVKGLMARKQLLTPEGAAAIRGFLRTAGQEGAEELMGPEP
jgi:hypothetical protein